MANSEWLDIEDAPKDGTLILALYDNNLFYEPVVVRWSASNVIYPWANGDGTNAYPNGRLAFWMPIPELPK